MILLIVRQENHIKQFTVLFSDEINNNFGVVSTSSYINNGEITITVDYIINNTTVPGKSTTVGDPITFDGAITINIGTGFSMSTPTIQFSSVVTV